MQTINKLLIYMKRKHIFRVWLKMLLEGTYFIIAKACKQMVKVIPMTVDES